MAIRESPLGKSTNKPPTPPLRTKLTPPKLGKTLLLHSEIFLERLLPELRSYRDNWDNLAGGDPKATDVSFEDCHDLCEGVATCTQFALEDGKCFIGKGPKLGIPKQGTQSGWLMGRIQKLVAESKTCSKPQFS